jgi:hypothetical protein
LLGTSFGQLNILTRTLRRARTALSIAAAALALAACASSFDKLGGGSPLPATT